MKVHECDGHGKVDRGLVKSMIRRHPKFLMDLLDYGKKVSTG
jgi:hypothetical protein